MSRLSRLFRKPTAAAETLPPSIAPPQPPAPFPDAGAAARVVLYVEGWCSDCKKAERLVTERGWPTHREDMKGRYAEKLERLAAAGTRSLPVVFLDGKPLGGLKALASLEALP